MQCPNCSHKLTTQNYLGIEVNKCPNCEGMWFDANEVDQLEDTVFDQDEFKNSMITNLRPSDRSCPKCNNKMSKFNYRWEDLELEYCVTGHGFWIDKGEEKRITEIMEEQENETERKFKSEEQWANNLKSLQSPSFVDKIKKILTPNKD